MSSYEVHNVRFYKPKPYPVYSMALCENKKLLAVGRSDASIEIWNLQSSPFTERRIPPIVNNDSMEQLCWYKNRLFSVGLHGFLIEYDLHDLTIKHKSAVTGEAAFCLDASESQSQLAIGTEQGYLNIFNVYDEILFEKFLDKQEGRILCLKYFPNGQYIASGSEDTIRIWNVKSGQAIHRLTTGRSEANKVTIVWCVQVTSDSIVISGDSRGKLTFWDAKVGSQIESYQSHRADVLSICVSDDEKSLYCAGVDPIIMCYEKVEMKHQSYKWVKSIQRKVHDHDVRALVLCNNKLYSSGIDGYLACTYHPPKTLNKFAPILPNPCICLSKKARLILLRYSKHLEIWRLGKAAKSNKDDSLMKLDSQPKKLLELYRTIKDDSGQEQREGIISAAISDCGKWIVFSTDLALRIFKFSCDNEKPSLIPMDRLSKEYPVCLQATFTPNSSFLVIACRQGDIKVINLLDFSCQTINTSTVLEDTITFLKVSNCGRYLIAADPQSNISVWTNNSNNCWDHYCKLPKYHDTPTAMSVNPRKSFLLVVYADHKIVEYNLKYRKFTKFSNFSGIKLQQKWLTRWYAVRNVIFDSKSRDVVILHDDASIVIVNKKESFSEPEKKIARVDGNSPKKRKAKQAVHAIKKYKHLVHLEWLSEEELVAVEVRPLTLTEQLPPCLKQNLFGTK